MLNNCPTDIKRKVIHIVKNENTQKDKDKSGRIKKSDGTKNRKELRKIQN